ncbi:MAG: cadherin-like domain-containing protein, partial [Methylocystaceae bacterium]|nr:cadherin-like domain-containing protein [Methylocystaceae bacterium]
MAQNQGTKSSIEMFDLDNMGNEEGLSDQVFVINDFEIEQESDLTLQATHMGSDKSKAIHAEGYTGDGAAQFKDNSAELQRLHVKVPQEDLQDAAGNDQIAIIKLDLSDYVEDGSQQAVIKSLPEGTKVFPTEDPEVVIIAIDPQEVNTLNIQIDVVELPQTDEAQATEENTTTIITDPIVVETPDGNVAPIVSEDTSFTMNEDGTITITEEQLLANASDANGDELSVVNLTINGEAVELDDDGSFTFTPDENFNGEIDLSYQVSDGTLSVDAGGTITVEAVNDGPDVSGATSFDASEDNSITLTQEDLLANATDVEGDDLSVLNLTADTGTIVDNGDGSWTFTPDENFNGDVNLSYDVTDGTDTTAAEGVISVEEVNDAAVVGDDVEFDINEDGTITISEDDLLANASDVDGDTLSVVNLSVDDGTLTDNGDGTWTFTPDENFNGEVNISFDVSDGTVETEAAGTIDVASVNDGPVVSEETSFTMNEDGTITLTEDQLLANASDVDGDDLSVSNVA